MLERAAKAPQGAADASSEIMRLITFTVVGLIAMVVAYSFGVPPAVSAVIFLFVLFNGILDRWAVPLLERLRA